MLSWLLTATDRTCDRRKEKCVGVEHSLTRSGIASGRSDFYGPSMVKMMLMMNLSSDAFNFGGVERLLVCVERVRRRDG